MKDATTASLKSRTGLWRYVPEPGHWDEVLTPAGFPRRHWRALLVALGRMGPEQLSRRWRAGQQLIQANGITYNVYGDPQGKERPWKLDLIPLVIDAAEWERLERAIIQRATLLNAMLADLYGPQNLIHQRHLPAATLFANPHFLRPCCGIVPAGGVHLHLYAADLARSPSGQWWAIADRTQAPSGIGYALENRLVSAQTLPSVFNQCRVRQLQPFFEAARAALLALAPNLRANPRAVLLTPGPHNETYFEHSFLARQWGFPLVEGADLTVRDNRVFLKTLAGLEPVDLVLRRMDDSFCDPLELRGDSLLGVPGLVQALRSGNVAVANALGSGILETALQMAFLPGLCRQLLGEDLRMPSVATWWCGDEEPRRYVLEHLEELVIKPTFPRYGQNAEFPATMSEAARRELAHRIEARPEQFVAQEQVDLSTAPVRADQVIAARHIVLRVFAVWNGSSYMVLPGGLTRVSQEDRSLVVSMQLGGGSKDTWVLSAAETDTPAVRRTAETAVTTPRSSAELPSRVADNLFWLGRYAERVESGVRLVRALLPGLSGEADFGRSATLETVLHLLGGLNYLPPEFSAGSIASQRWNLQRLLGTMVFDPTRTSGIGWNLNQIRRVSWPLKERLSQDTWRVLQQLEMDFSSTPPASTEQRFVAAMSLLDRAIVTLSAFAGLLMENTTRGYGWRFLEVGRRLERALQMTELLRVGAVQAPFEIEPYLETLLQIADSSITYRTRYLTALRIEFVLALLLADESNPRSVAFQFATLLDHAGNLQQRDPSASDSIEHATMARMLAEIRNADMDDLATRDAEGDLGALEDLLKQMRTGLFDISDALTARYFSHLTPSRLTSF
ncbi:MAG TPA: circularly permuted type 2 ATP-grasp protein [Bryobacteraceae bacterium]|nr:circularly permuted type 2 ATP-grasp protein [Bryobacteraceae bacterium]